MEINQKTYCDFCGLVIHPNDGTRVHIPHKGKPKEYTFHNTREMPCLSKELDVLRTQFTPSQP